MAKKKPDPKPIFPLKHEFYESLDHLLNQVMMLVTVCEQIVDLDLLKKTQPTIEEMLKERTKAVRQCWSEE